MQAASVASTYASSGEAGHTPTTEEHRKFSSQEAREVGERIGTDCDTSRFDVEQFRMGLEVELEHGRRDPSAGPSGSA
jgi:hypothetical protein